jgi:peptide methionine sulfoxide reductase MsrB
MTKIILTENEWKKFIMSNEYHTIRKKALDRPFMGNHVAIKNDRKYNCGVCGSPLFENANVDGDNDSFPIFEIPVKDAVAQKLDGFGKCIDIVCNKCDNHLGPLFIQYIDIYHCTGTPCQRGSELDNKEKETPCNYCGMLLYSYDESNQLVVLLGREAIVNGWKPSGKWSDFGGSPENLDDNILESRLETATRECYQETMGILGCRQKLEFLISKKEPVYLPETKAATYVVKIKYDAKMPEYFNRIYKYLTICTKDHPNWKGYRYIPSCPNGYVEKCEMKWFRLEEIIQHLDEPENESIYRASFLNSLKQIIKTNPFDPISVQVDKN